MLIDFRPRSSIPLLEDLALVCGNLPEDNDNDPRGQSCHPLGLRASVYRVA